MSLTKATYSMIEGAPLNVLDFGAIQNNSTDNTAAVQAAIRQPWAHTAALS
jgi:polygalacturonase